MNTQLPASAVHPSEFRRIYVWELPVRFFHWLNALCIVVLGATGVLIAHPPALASAAEASFSYWFGINRFIHFLTAYVFTANFALRIYWGFAGNTFADWRNFLPLRRAQFRQVREVLQVDILQTRDQPIVAVGHNAVAYFTYLALFLVMAFQVVSGFALYTATSTAWFPSLFAWAGPLFGGDYALREWHSLATWCFGLFTLVHVYLVAYHDYVEGHGVMSSMVGGWKFLHSAALRRSGQSQVTARRSSNH